MTRAAKVQFEDAFSVIEPEIAEGVHVHPFDSACPVDVRFLKFGKKHSIRLNRHEYFELLYVHSGEVVYHVHDRYLLMKRGDLFVMGSTLMHRMSEYPKGSVMATVLYFLPDLIRSGDAPDDALAYLRAFLVQDTAFPHVIPAANGIPARVAGLIHEIAALLPAGSVQSRLSVKTYLKMALVLLMQHYAGYRGSVRVQVQREHDLERLRPLFQHVDAKYSSGISVTEAADLLHLGKSSFMRLFKQVTGESFVGYLNRFRVAKAEVLLASTDMSIAEVGQETGFYDQSYFGVTFRNLLHVTPKEYRQRLHSDLGREARTK